jgi:hypothetical protein
VVAAALAGDREHDVVRGLREPLVRPDDDRVVTVLPEVRYTTAIAVAAAISAPTAPGCQLSVRRGLPKNMNVQRFRGCASSSE